MHAVAGGWPEDGVLIYGARSAHQASGIIVRGCRHSKCFSNQHINISRQIHGFIILKKW